jgi:aminoglycoside phosphotransferase (APT) family kinase protein
MIEGAIGGVTVPTMFSFVKEGHSFNPELERLRSFLAERAESGDLAREAEGAVTHAEIKGVRNGDGSWRLDRFYWCRQYEDPRRTPPFRARTLLYLARRGQPELYEFPHDSYLTAMAAYFSAGQTCGEPIGDVKVLRYVPLRRLTFRVTLGSSRRAVIGKFKRPSKLHESYDRLVSIHRSVQAAGVSFAVAAPLGVDEAAAAFYQEFMPGEVLASAVTLENHLALMAHLGTVHGELHQVEVTGVPAWSLCDYCDTLQHDVDWIAFLVPDAEVLLRRVWERLRRCAPEARVDGLRLCHGDFVPSQLLIGGPRTVVTDFDIGHLGDPRLEMGNLLASLKYDVPLFSKAFETTPDAAAGLMRDAESAYLHGYRETARTSVDPRHLLWFRTCAEIHYLSLMLKKDWYRPDLFRRALGVVDSLEYQLRG